MIPKQRALLAALLAGGSAVPAAAGCFDWLFHSKTAPPAAPYAVGYVPATTVTPLGPPVPVGAPTLSAPVQAGTLPAQPGMVQPAAAADLTPVTQPTLGPGGYLSNFGGYRSATAAQMPAYGAVPAPINNPSVLTGMPVMPSAGGTATAYYGAAQPVTSYNAPAAYNVPPAFPATPAAPPASSGCFLSRLFGHHYRSQYNAVPTTVYRPVQQVDPTSGQMVIVQQPCTTVTQQVQRTPYAALQPAQPLQPAPAAAPLPGPYYGDPSCGNESLGYSGAPATAPNAAAPQAVIQPGGYPPAGPAVGSGLSQATALDGPGQGYAAPIPSTAEPAPLQGYPNGAAGDTVPLQQPRLESARPSFPAPAPPPAPAPSPAPSPTAPAEPAQAAWQNRALTSPGGSRDYSDLPPIPAADDYRPPAWHAQPQSAEPPRNDSFQRPLAPPSLEGHTVSQPRSERFNRSEPAPRYAASPRVYQRPSAPPAATSPASRPATPPPRNDGGWHAIAP